jgi:hypothetical protein
METTLTVKRVIAGTLLSGGLAVAGVGLGAGIAQADRPSGPYTWCPGQSMDRGQAMDTPSGPDWTITPTTKEHFVWDMSVCHTWYLVADGWGNVPWIAPNGQQTLASSDVWDGPNPPGPNPGGVACGLMFCPNPGGNPPGWHG